MDIMLKIKNCKNHFLKYYGNNDYHKAQLMGKQIIDLYKQNRLTHLSNYPKDLFDIACAYDEGGKVEQAANLYLKASEAIIKNSEYSHSEEGIQTLGNIYNNLAIVYQRLHRPDVAASYFKKSYNFRHSILPKGSDDFAESCYNLGTFYKESKRFNEAAHYYAEALNLRSKKDIHYADNLFNLGICYIENSSCSIGCEFIKNSLEIYKEIKRNPSEYITALNFFAVLLYRIGSYSSALESYNELCSIIKAAHGTNIPTYASACSALANCYARLDDMENAIPLKKKALKLLQKQFGENSIYYMDSLRELAHIYLHGKFYENAALLFAKVLDMYSKAYGLDNEKSTDIIFTLTNVYLNMKLYTKAVNLLNYALNNISDNRKTYDKLILKLVQIYMKTEDGQGLNEAFMLFNKIHPDRGFDEMLDMSEDIDY